MIIAIDGPAAAGKGTLAKRLEAVLHLPYLDTGSLYRSVAAMMIEEGADTKNPQIAYEYSLKISPEVITSLENQGKLRTNEAGIAASLISSYPMVREALLTFQRDFPSLSEQEGAILDGRDIGTVIFPDATYKFFLTASSEVRAQRRFLEFQAKGMDITYEKVLDDMIKRDEQDTNRQIAAMKPAVDAIIIDTSGMNEDEVFNEAIKHIKR